VLLTPSQLANFADRGFLHIPGFYDLKADIEPIQRGIHSIIGALLHSNALRIPYPEFCPETFDEGYQDVLAHDRRLGSLIYDAVKQIPAFIRLVSHTKHEQLFRALRPGSMPGVAHGGYGIRIDNPGETRFMAPWHQDYPAQLRSPDGIVFWSPLIPVTKEMGPVCFCLGSHRDGPRSVMMPKQIRNGTQGAYDLRLVDEQKIIESYFQEAPLSKPGDLIVVDYFTIHASGYNHSKRSRWTMQMRYFNFASSAGISMGWKGSFAEGVDLKKVHPELVHIHNG
jgi:hypothetical protein